MNTLIGYISFTLCTTISSLQLQKHLYLAVRHNDADKVARLLAAGADQFAEVEGTGMNPREEAMRQKHYPILRQMVALAKKEPRPEDDKIIALEDVYKLFEVSGIKRNVLQFAICE